MLFLVSTLAVLALLTLLSVKDKGIPLGGDVYIKFPDAHSFFVEGKVVHADIDSIIGQLDTSFLAEPDTLQMDSVQVDSVAPLQLDSNLMDLDFDHLHPIEYPDSNEAALDRFFAKLEEARRKGKKVRILHYGDSQIEGDRITAYVRERLQDVFGGYGPGLISIRPLYNQVTINIRQSPNWRRYTYFLSYKNELPHYDYGAMSRLCRFTNYKTDSASKATTAWFEVSPSKRTYGRARIYRKLRLFYGKNYRKTLVRIYEDGELVKTDSLIPDGRYHAYDYSFSRTPSKLRFELETNQSPDFYGISLEGNNGLLMDNLAMRGSSGRVFTRHNRSLLSKNLRDLGADLIILQYGGNGVPSIKGPESAERYAKGFAQQIYRVKSVAPQAEILVVGPSDMSTRRAGAFVTYPQLPNVIKFLKEAARETGVAYWDVFTAMGGKNSMPTWVRQGLAAKDYIHFSHKGAKFAAQMFYQALIYEYQKYLHRKEQEQNGTIQ